MTAIHWLRAINGSFNTSADWSGGSIPGPSDDAVLDAAGGPFTVTSITSVTVESVQLAANASLTISGGTFTAAAGTGLGANAGTILVTSGATLAVQGTVTNAGAIDLHAAANGACLAIGAAGVTLSGGGTIMLSETRQRAAQINGGSTAKLINVDNTIEGAGAIGLGGMTLVNDTHGVIDATSATMGLYVEAGAVTNAGLIEATGQGKLIVSGTINNHLHGVIKAGSGAYVTLSYADIMGGTLIKSGTGLLVARNTVLDGTQSPVVIVGMLDSFNLALRGAINNNGIVNLNDQGRIDANVTLSGGGTMTSGDFYGGAAGVTVFNVDNTITGYGIGGGGMTFVNEAKGVIDSVNMVINMQGQTLINAGLVEATGRGRF